MRGAVHLQAAAIAVILAGSAALIGAQTPPAGGRGTVTVEPGRGRGAGTPAPAGAPPAPARGGGGLSAGPNDQPPVDSAAADRARTVWAAECINCHGTQARGTDLGPNLVRSVLVLHDRFGSELAPFLQKGHTMQSGRSSTALDKSQIVDLAHFLRQRVNDGLRGSPLFQPGDVLTGDKSAGQAYFNGAGGCTTCHSTTGNLAGIGGRFSPIDLQQRMLFPVPARGGGPAGRGGRGAAAVSPVTVTVTPASGPAVSGVLVQMDDFAVTLRDESGVQRTFTRSPSVKVAKTVPLQAHYDLLDRLTDKNIHDLVAYLESLK